jgi:hypothetical protein
MGGGASKNAVTVRQVTVGTERQRDFAGVVPHSSSSDADGLRSAEPAEAIDVMSVRELRAFIAEAGLRSEDCLEKSDLRARAEEAQAAQQDMRARAEEASAGRPAPAAVMDSQVLPLGWRQCVSRSTGETYYSHDETGATQWDVPGVEMVPDGWERVESRDTGEAYYLNRLTGEAQFEMPAVAAVAEAVGNNLNGAERTVARCAKLCQHLAGLQDVEDIASYAPIFMAAVVRSLPCFLFSRA